MPNSMSPVEVKEKAAQNKLFLDTIDLPVPSEEERLSEYIDRVNERLVGVSIPEDYRGDIFFWLDFFELTEYLIDRFGVRMSDSDAR